MRCSRWSWLCSPQPSPARSGGRAASSQRFGFRRPGLLAGVFGIGYGLARIVSEFFRDPDPDSERLAYGLTMGMLLSLPMVLAGLALLLNALRRPPLAAGEALR